ncbi:hypothetical protein [Streptomyces cupreus]|uniref:Uncharacterized protein n=1 Tax=Streptomyces cupreus TaxID=2759956 RepID=A0A7X1MDQ7_9ACTN|nr:hypothetical protein [Streptomyces cupreus]MBC2904975.1 hypothetical protein [Streptomyces cupreus]
MGEATGTIIAAVIAFASAVIGAVIAGRYARGGAEAGGRKAVEAALAQVHGQAAAEHWQWVRSQRHQSFAALFVAYAVLDEVLIRIAPEVRSSGGLDAAARRELGDGTLEMQAKTSQLALWGPGEANELAYALTETSIAAVASLLAVAGTNPEGMSAAWSRFARAREEMAQAHAAFLQRAGEIVRDPRQPVS